MARGSSESEELEDLSFFCSSFLLVLVGFDMAGLSSELLSLQGLKVFLPLAFLPLFSDEPELLRFLATAFAFFVTLGLSSSESDALNCDVVSPLSFSLVFYFSLQALPFHLSESLELELFHLGFLLTSLSESLELSFLPVARRPLNFLPEKTVVKSS